MIRSALRLRMPSWGARRVSVTLMANDSNEKQSGSECGPHPN